MIIRYDYSNDVFLFQEFNNHCVESIQLDIERKTILERELFI